MNVLQEAYDMLIKGADDSEGYAAILDGKSTAGILFMKGTLERTHQGVCLASSERKIALNLDSTEFSNASLSDDLEGVLDKHVEMLFVHRRMDDTNVPIAFKVGESIYMTRKFVDAAHYRLRERNDSHRDAPSSREIDESEKEVKF
ncbi:MAG: hypothetical protein ABIH34_02465 [Nanoarchaeota archaeon]